MNISFKNIKISGFQSIGEAEVDLSSQGIVIVKGVNNYEDNASSNGSGKSSIFEAILWAIYGRTSFGITDPTNRYTENGCYVKLDFSVDNKNYTIVRSIKSKEYGTVLTLMRDNDDISGRNKTDTEKMIKNDILKVDIDIFLSTIFLSQGFSGRISTLTPSGRKERIETLTDTARLVDDFSTRMSNLKAIYSLKLDESNRKRSYSEGQRDNLTRQIEAITKEAEESEKNRPSESLEELEAELQKATEENARISEESDSIDRRIRQIDSITTRAQSRIRELENIIEDNRFKLSKMNGSICPTCGQPINNDKHEELRKEYLGAIESAKKDIDILSSKLGDSTKEYGALCIRRDNGLKVRKNDSFHAILSLKEKIGRVKSFDSSRSNKEKIDSLKSELYDTNANLEKIGERVSDNEIMLGVAKSCQGLITKQFRGYLLQEIINFMNSRLERYSTYLFAGESERINLVIDASKLDIYLGDVLYDTLSGGEKKKVDLALVLTQRDLALNVAGFSCNLLILDEVLENLDNTATTCSLNLLMEASSDIESMFIISHNNYSIQSDSVMTIEKGKDRISSVKTDVI